MILVSGTQRSGTSLWMQILRAAGFPIVGDAFPEGFGERLRTLNPRGFYESPLRDGIHFDSNPDPFTGDYLHPADVRRHAVKVFTPGLTKTDLAYVDRVIVCVRDCSSYVRSVARMRAEDVAPEAPPAPAYLVWWHETYGAVFDALLRRYPVRFVSYARTVDAPEATIEEVLDFVGGGDRAAAIAAVDPSLRHHPPEAAALPEPHARFGSTFDRLYDALHRGAPIDDALRDALDEAHLALAPALEPALARRMEARLRARLDALATGTPPDPARGR